MQLSGDTIRSGAIATAIAALTLNAGILHAQEQLQIAWPGKGQILNPGSNLIVTIQTPATPFKRISLAGDGPFSHSAVITAPPYRFPYMLPPNLPAGRYRLKAEGITESGTSVFSEPIEVDVEYPEKPRKLQVEWQMLSVGEHESAALVIWGVFADGSRVDLTRSTQITYASDRPDIAGISAEGMLSGTAAGKARITAKYADKSIVVPVVVTAAPH